MIEKYNIAKQKDSRNFKNLYFQMKKILDKFSEAWRTGDTSDILNLLKKQSILMKQLDNDFDIGIYTEEHKNLSELAESLGLFYKPSGAGGGDLGFVMSDDLLKMKQFSHIIETIDHPIVELNK
jgi:mevalonate kinase